jgi:hypothetical protein
VMGVAEGRLGKNEAVQFFRQHGRG